MSELSREDQLIIETRMEMMRPLIEDLSKIRLDRDAWQRKAEALAAALASFSLRRKSCDETYNGGHRGDKCEAFHHGMNTVFNVYDEYAKAALVEYRGDGK